MDKPNDKPTHDVAHTPAATTNPAAPWYCVRAQPKRERMAAANLTAQFAIETYCPLIRFQRSTVRGLVWFEEALFPGYFFARFELATQTRAVTYAPGVLNIPRFGDVVVPIAAAVIDAVRADLAAEAERAATPPPAFQPGQEVSVQAGAMQGLSVQVVKLMPAQERVRVLMEWMGTLVAANFPIADLAPVKRGQ